MLELDKVYLMDCLEGLKLLPDKSIDLVIADPPYYNIMVIDHKGNRHEWDCQWDSFDDYLYWCKQWIIEVKRVLKTNGSIYVFQDDKNCAYVQVIMDGLGLNLENSITWVKPNNMPIKGWNRFRSYSPITEKILFYSKEKEWKGHIGVFDNMRKRLNEERINAGFATFKEVNEFLGVSTNGGGMACHYFSEGNQIWELPTKEVYLKLQKTGFFKKQYEELRLEYEELRLEYEELRRPFLPKYNYTDVWTFNITSSSDQTFHPTQKPIALTRRIVDTSSKINDVVLDLFAGSFTTAVACKQLNRRFIGFENNEEYFKLGNERLSQKCLYETKQENNLKSYIKEERPKGGCK